MDPVNDAFYSDPEVALALAELERRGKYNSGASYVPYAKQAEFHALGKTKMERMFFAGSQTGKTFSAAQETAYHATGDYPKWWQGFTFTRPPVGWVGSASYAAQRGAAQAKLLGTETPLSTPEQVGTGSLPRSSILKLTPTRGVADSVDTIVVKHRTGDPSTITFKTYDQDQMKWAGATIDYCWMDEEPPRGIYFEAQTRVAVRKGRIYTTFTPIYGVTDLVRRFRDEASDDRAMIRMTAYESGNYTKEEVDARMANYPPWERAARIQGLPAAGEGKIILLDESRYITDPLPLAAYWPRVIGLDIGMLHPTAAVWVAWDRDRNRLVVYDEYREKSLRINEHAGSLLMRGAGEIPVAWPQDAHQREQGTGESVMVQYKKLGLRMMQSHAQVAGQSNALWPSVTDLISRLGNDQLKIFSSCKLLLEELMNYHHHEGKIVDKDDDLISALRYACMMYKHGDVLSSGIPGERAWRRKQPQVAQGLDVDPWAR